MMNLTDEETLALVNLLEHTIRDDPYPLSPRVRALKTILEKLVEPRPGEEPLAPLPPQSDMSCRRRVATGAPLKSTTLTSRASGPPAADKVFRRSDYPTLQG
jgi:hypothetical protein